MSFVVVAHNIRSIHNVGSIFRTCEGFGAKKLFLSGYTPYPEVAENDSRLPHLRQKLTSQIHKTALGAEKFVPFEYHENIIGLISMLKEEGYLIFALEQHHSSMPLSKAVRPGVDIALILGEEVNGISENVLSLADVIAEIPMQGNKESFNVSVAAGIAMYAICHPS